MPLRILLISKIIPHVKYHPASLPLVEMRQTKLMEQKILRFSPLLKKVKSCQLRPLWQPKHRKYSLCYVLTLIKPALDSAMTTPKGAIAIARASELIIENSL